MSPSATRQLLDAVETVDRTLPLGYRTSMVDKDAVLGRWSARGFEGGLWIDPPGQVWEDYVHGVEELFMVVEGQVELEIQGRASRPAIGEEVLIPARARHSVRNVGPGTARWLYSYRRR